MSSKEEIVEVINSKAEEIRALKALKPATLKKDLEPLIADLLNLKLAYKDITGEDYDKPKEEKKKEPVEVKEREGPSKTELNKLKRKEAKAAAQAAKKDSNPELNLSTKSASGVTDEDTSLYGDYPLIQSTFMTEKAYRNIEDLTEDREGQSVWLRGRVSNSRAVGKGVFLVIRQTLNTVQAVVYPDSDKITKSFVKYTAGIPLESVIDILAKIVLPETPVLSTTLKNIELAVEEIHIVSKATELPFLVDDAGRNVDVALEKSLPLVNQDTSLNYRWIDLRTPANQAIFRIQSGVCQLFREFFISRNFIEIHTPKLIGGASEGGSNVFQLKYFEQPACLAQSPQLYKQMVAACGGFDRIFEIGPVFRAENSNTHRLF